MAPKKEYIFGGIGGIICISAIVLAIVFGILWGQQRDKRKSCDDDLIKSAVVSGKCLGCLNCLTTSNKIFDACYKNVEYGVDYTCINQIDCQQKLDAQNTCVSDQQVRVSECSYNFCNSYSK
jgi:hypothetical protein